MEETELQRYQRYRNDPWAFLQECVYTRDAVDQDNPVKGFPDYEYLLFFTRLWQRERRIAVPKSRRMTMSWTCIALYVWESIFYQGKETAFVSKKEDDALELVSRAEFIFSRIPQDKIPRALLPTVAGGSMKKSPPRIEWDFGNGNKSYIQGFPMGADQLRQYTFSGVFGDEAAFWPEAEKFYSGTKPTTDGGGKMTLVSSRAPGFFKKLVFDKVNFKGSNFATSSPVSTKYPMQGVEIWKNPLNKFCIMDLHYTAHPDKRDPQFKQDIKNSMPLHEYLREYEKNWETFAGMPVFPDYRKDIHLAKAPLEPHLGLPLLFGWDFGLTPACIVAQLQGNSLKVLHEWVDKNKGIDTFAPKVMNTISQLYPNWNNPRKDHFHFIDPAGFQKAQTDARTCAQVMAENAPIVNIEPGPVDLTSRKKSVNDFLLYVDRDGPGVELMQETCPTLCEGMAGGYRYKDSQNDVESERPMPVKDMYSHPCDAFQYLCYGARSKMNTHTYGITIPPPAYRFNHDNSGRKGKIKYGLK